MMRKQKENDWCLSYDITVNIFQRLPLKKLAQFKLVSSKWYLLISSNRFATSLLQYPNFAKLSYTLVFQTHNSISSLKHNDTKLDDKIDEFHDIVSVDGGDNIGGDDTNDVSELSLKTSLLKHPLPETHKGIHYYCAGSYNGIVCIQITSPEFEERILVWNPVTREVKDIPLPPNYSNDIPPQYACFKKRFWFGYVDVLDDVLIFCLKQTRTFVYSMKQGRWRNSRSSGQFDIGLEPTPCRNLGSRFVHIDGILYCTFGVDFILMFDLVTGSFEKRKFLDVGGSYIKDDNMMTNEIITQKNKLCSSFYIKDDNMMTYEIVEASLGVTQENKLCSGRVFRCKENGKWILEIWTLEDHTELELGWGSWQRLHRVELGKQAPASYPWLIRFTHDERVFVGTHDKLVLVDPKRVSGLQVQEVETKHVAVYTVDYVQTLLSPDSLERLYLLESHYF